MRRRHVFPLAAISTAALALSACGGSSDASEDAAAASQPSGEAEAFPVTIEHAFGETVIEEAPERVATVAWANHEVPLALGVVPVGMAKATWGDDDDNGVLPWVEDQLEALDAEVPVLFDETDGIDFEAVSDTEPDVILAAYSGLTEDDYTTLSQIAPVVAYPEIAWGTSMYDMVEINSRAMGLSAEGEQLNADLEQQIDDVVAEFPQMQDASAVFSWLDVTDLSQIGFYTTHDPRAAFLNDLGMITPEHVAQTSSETEDFWATVSAEQAELFDDADIFISYGQADGSTVETIQADSLMAQIPAVADGAIAILPDSTPLAAAANPSPLSIGWGLHDYVALLAEAVDNAS